MTPLLEGVSSKIAKSESTVELTKSASISVSVVQFEKRNYPTPPTKKF